MFDWIPLRLYTDIYHYILLLTVVMVAARAVSVSLEDRANLRFLQILGLFLLCFVILYMGTRPIGGRYFGDMGVYAGFFKRMQQLGWVAVGERDRLFEYYMFFCSRFMSPSFFFLFTAFLYTYPLYLVSKRLFKEGWFYAFLLLIASFSFWSYGTNGIRNGLGTSIFLLVFLVRSRLWQAVILAIAIGVHSSLIIPTAAFVISIFVRNTKLILTGWFLSIPLALVAGGIMQFILAGAFADDRVSYLTAGNVNNDAFSSTGFRWDFVLYSATAVYAGWYYIIKKRFADPLYKTIYSTYLITNAFWILVIYANFSNRFAYLSWFMMALVIIYPLLKQYIVPKQHQVIGFITLAYFAFTFVMNVILN